MVAKFVLHAVFKSIRHGLVGKIRLEAVLGPVQVHLTKVKAQHLKSVGFY